MKLPLSAFVLTLNEESNIAACLRTLTFCDDIHVVDSDSADRTQDIAAETGATVHTRVLRNWADHGNWILHNVPFAHEYVLYMDADERVTSALRAEIVRELETCTDLAAAYRLRYTTYLFDRPLNHGGVSDVWVTRLLRRDRVSYESRRVNAHPIVDGHTRDFQNPYEHHTFSKGMPEWFRKHNSYSTMEALEAIEIRRRGFVAAVMRSDMTAKRRLKTASFFVPMRGSVRFLYTYVIRRGFLDGIPGLWYACLIALYESWIGIKVRAELDQPGSLNAIEFAIERAISTVADANPRRAKVSEIPKIQVRLVQRMLDADPMSAGGWRPARQRRVR